MNLFYSTLLSHPFSYIIIFIAVSFIYYVFFRRYIYSLFDPLLFSFLFSVLCSSDVVLMGLYKQISWFYFSSYILTQSALIVGFRLIPPIKLQKILNTDYKRIYLEESIEKYLYLISVFLFLFAQVISYWKLGIPIFTKGGRLVTYAGGGGLGLLERTISVTRPVILVYLLHKFVKKRFDRLDKLLLAILLITAFLTGSKSAILKIVFTTVLFEIFLWKDHNVFPYFKKIRIVIFIIALLGSIATISIAFSGDGISKSPIVALGMRLLNSGDVYMYAYTSNVLNTIPKSSAIEAIFKDLIGFSRLISWHNLPTALGLNIWQYYHHNFYTVKGPNPRHNVFGLFYFGYYGSIIFSFIVGIISSFFRNSLYRMLPKGIVSATIYIILYPLMNIRSDITLELKVLTDFVFIFIPMLLIAYIFSQITHGDVKR